VYERERKRNLKEGSVWFMFMGKVTKGESLLSGEGK